MSLRGDGNHDTYLIAASSTNIWKCFNTVLEINPQSTLLCRQSFDSMWKETEATHWNFREEKNSVACPTTDLNNTENEVTILMPRHKSLSYQVKCFQSWIINKLRIKYSPKDNFKTTYNVKNNNLFLLS